MDTPTPSRPFVSLSSFGSSPQSSKYKMIGAIVVVIVLVILLIVAATTKFQDDPPTPVATTPPPRVDTNVAVRTLTQQMQQNMNSRQIGISDVAKPEAVKPKAAVSVVSDKPLAPDAKSASVIAEATRVANTAIDCVVSPWSDWSDCGPNKLQNRTRTIITPSANGGKECPMTQQTQDCVYVPPARKPIDCEVGPWGDWTACDVTNNTRTRSRAVKTQNAYGGAECPNLTETVQDLEACPKPPPAPTPVDCQLSGWGDWSSCDANYSRTHTRTILTQPANGGKACDPLSETVQDFEACPKPAAAPAPVDCQLSEWGDWSSCDANNSRTHTRTVLTQPANGGKACDPLSETVQDFQACPKPVDCQLSGWGDWSSCDANNSRTHTRTILTQPQYGGKACDSLSETVQDFQACPKPVDCKVSDWSAWSDCDSNWNRTRSRSILTQPAYGGQACPSNLTDSAGAPDICAPRAICSQVTTNSQLTNDSLNAFLRQQDANNTFWSKLNCSLPAAQLPSGVTLDALCAYATAQLNSTDPMKREAYLRAKTLLQCPGTVLVADNFVGAGTTSGNYFTIVVTQVLDQNSELNMNQNIGKKIRIWYDANGSPIGWAYSNDWVYPQRFGNVKLNQLGATNITSALEVMDKNVGTSYGYKFIIWFVGANNSTDQNPIPSNNPVGAIKWIVSNRPTSLNLQFGSDAGTWLGAVNLTGDVTYGSGSL